MNAARMIGTVSVIAVNIGLDKLICKKCGIEKKFMGFYNNYQDKLLPHMLCKCPHYETGEKLFKLTKNTKRGGKTKQYRLKLKIEELERRLKILT